METQLRNAIPVGLCQCGCGKKTKIAEFNRPDFNWVKGKPKRFIHGHHSKGFLNYNKKDLVHQRFGNLLALKPSFIKTKKRGINWVCLCSCGNITIVISWLLKNGSVTSCGCARTINESKFDLPPEKQSAINTLYYSYRNNARKRSIKFDLTKDQVVTLFQSNCFYCNRKPNQIIKKSKRHGSTFTYNGIDRVDNKKHYFLENCVACCGNCNRAKFKNSVSEFKEWVVDVYNNFVKNS